MAATNNKTATDANSPSSLHGSDQTSQPRFLELPLLGGFGVGPSAHQDWFDRSPLVLVFVITATFVPARRDWG